MPALAGSGSVPASSTRTSLRRARISSASGVASGAMITSRKRLARSVAVSRLERAVDRDDAAIDRHRIARIGLEIGAVLVRGDRHAARVGVLDHDDGRLAELGHAFVGGVGVVDVVVGELLALDLARRGDARPLAAVGIEGRLLMRVLAVAQGLHALGRDRQPLGEGLALLRGEPGGDRRIVRRRARIGLGGELAAQRQRGRALVRADLVEHRLGSRPDRRRR